MSDRNIGALIAIAGVVMFSAKAVMVKLGYRYEADTVTLLLLRMIFALPFYLAVMVRSTKKTNAYKLTRKDIGSIVGLGFIGYYLASYFDFYGLQFISASLERLILFIYPTLVIVISVIILKKKASRIQIYAILITYLGIFIAFADDLNMESEHLWIGVISIFLSALTYAFYLVGSGEMIPKLGAVRFTSYAMTVSCVMVILHYLFINSFEVLRQPWEVYVLGFGMATISTVIPSFLISEAINRLGASNFAIYGSLGPISTILLAIFFLGEWIDLYQIVGTVIVIVGVSIINIKK
ncbi:MAG: DMT family transporter [Cytophagales bacterium]|nr:DMT family transporter [Cytophagales bacterium]